VEASLGVPIGSVGRVDSLRICLVGNAWVRKWTLQRTKRYKRGALVGSWTTDTSGETSVGTHKLEEAIEKFVVISCPYTIGSVYMVQWRFSSC
jgi:hypothetical protein